MINYQLSQNLKLLGNDKFNHLTIILTEPLPIKNLISNTTNIKGLHKQISVNYTNPISTIYQFSNQIVYFFFISKFWALGRVRGQTKLYILNNLTEEKFLLIITTLQVRPCDTRKSCFNWTSNFVKKGIDNEKVENCVVLLVIVIGQQTNLLNWRTIQPKCVFSFMTSKQFTKYISCPTNLTGQVIKFLPFQFQKFDTSAWMRKMYHIGHAKITPLTCIMH